jgi:hypothetical protein
MNKWFIIGIGVYKRGENNTSAISSCPEIGQCSSEREAEAIGLVLAKERWPESEGWVYSIAVREISQRTLDAIAGKSTDTDGAELDPVWPEDLDDLGAGRV